MRAIIGVSLAVFVGLFALPAAAASRITTSDGTVMVGDIEGLADGTYTVRTAYGIIKVPAASILKIEAGDGGSSAPAAGSTGSSTTTTTTTPATTAPAVTSSSPDALRIAGSPAIGDELMPALVERYSGSLGFAQPRWTREGNDASDQIFHATDAAGGLFAAHLSRRGSASAFLALANGTANIGMASRPAQPEELTALEVAGSDATAQENVLALDGLAVLVNRDNPITGLSIAQMASIFDGEVTDWKELGGTPGPIHVLAQDGASGITDAFNGLVLKDKSLTDTAERLSSTDELSRKISSDPAAIGYGGFDYGRRAKALYVLTDCGLGLPASDFLIRSEEYPLSRRLYLYTAANASEPVNQFVRYALSGGGQDEAAKRGLFDLTPRLAPADYSSSRVATALAQVAQNSGNTAGDLRALEVFNKITALSRRVSTTFRFRPGSFDLDTRAVADIDRLVAAMQSSDFAGHKLIIVGFSDSQGSAVKNVRLSVQRANRVANLLAAKGVTAQNVFGLGRAAPVACNTSDEGYEKNRRVEIWLFNQRS